MPLAVGATTLPIDIYTADGTNNSAYISKLL